MDSNAPQKQIIEVKTPVVGMNGEHVNIEEHLYNWRTVALQLGKEEAADA